jgi:hypothetical protein
MARYDSIIIDFEAKSLPSNVLEQSRHARLVDEIVNGLDQFIKDGRVVLLERARKRALTKFNITVSE